MSFEWENGRILKKINTSDSSIQMSYDSNGMRTQKTVDGVKTNYYYDSNKNLIALVKGNDTLLFYYDSDGSATSFSYNGTMYFYVKNLQGDVIRIIDLAGTEVASYVYDAWGNIKDTKGEPTIREINPIRYRGYVYDTETSLYYLQSRYYDPFTGRFLNADVYADTQSGTPLSTNMFAYCENNPIISADYNGKELISLAVFGFIMAVSLGVGLATIAVVNTPSFKKGWSDLCNNIGRGLSEALKGLGNAVKWIASKSKEIANDIYKSFSKVKNKPKYKSNTELHHIVAKGSTKARAAQNALANVGIKYKSDNRNLIRIKTGLHRRLHTNKYYAFVNELVVDAYNKGKTYNQRKKNVEKVLKNLKSMISSMNKLAPF